MNFLMMMYYTEAPAPPGWYLAKALKKLGHNVYFCGPNCEINPGKNPNPYSPSFDLGRVISNREIDVVLEVESGGFDISWNPPGPLRSKLRGKTKFVYWGSDTHLKNLAYAYRQKMRNYDMSFFAQQEFVTQTPGAMWLPHACDPDIHCPDMDDKQPRYDVTFIGHQHPTVHQHRIRLLKSLGRQGMKVNVRQGWYLHRMGMEFRRSKIVLNCSLNGDLNMRFFEAMCSGACLVADWLPKAGLKNLGIVRGEHFIAYDNDNMALVALRKLLQDDERREKVAKQGQKLAQERHTYTQRAEAILSRL